LLSISIILITSKWVTNTFVNLLLLGVTVCADAVQSCEYILYLREFCCLEITWHDHYVEGARLV